MSNEIIKKVSKRGVMAEGAPSKYKPEYCQMVIDCMSQGDSLLAFTTKIGIVRSVAYGWAKEFPAFSAALSQAQEASQMWWEKMTKAGSCGKIHAFNSAMSTFLLKSRFKGDYAEIQTVKQETTHIMKHADLLDIMNQE